MSREVKVGALIIAALVALAVGVFFVGERNNLFVLKNAYYIHFENVGGLAPGSPVQLNGVIVGKVRNIVLPEAVDEKLLTVNIGLDRRYASRVRDDSIARIKTLGLLGDKYIEISSGSPTASVIEVGGRIEAASATDVDRLLSSGEDAVDNFVAISYSLRGILDRLEAGEGILGELLVETEAGEKAKASIVETVGNLERISSRLDRGEGTLGSLLRDDALITRLEGSLVHLEAVLASVDSGEGALGALLTDPEVKEDFTQTLGNLRSAAEGADRIVSEFHSEAGLLQKFLRDEAYADKVGRDLKELIENLNLVSEKLEQGEGSLGQIINDPNLYQAMDDIVVGINESKLLRWLIRNRQKKGVKKRYKAAQEEVGANQPLLESPQN